MEHSICWRERSWDHNLARLTKFLNFKPPPSLFLNIFSANTKHFDHSKCKLYFPIDVDGLRIYLHTKELLTDSRKKLFFLFSALKVQYFFPPFSVVSGMICMPVSLWAVFEKVRVVKNVWSGRTTNGLNIFARSARDNTTHGKWLCYMERIPRGEPWGQRQSREGKPANLLRWGGESEGLVRIWNPVVWAGVWCSQGS